VDSIVCWGELTQEGAPTPFTTYFTHIAASQLYCNSQWLTSQIRSRIECLIANRWYDGGSSVVAFFFGGHLVHTAEYVRQSVHGTPICRDLSYTVYSLPHFVPSLPLSLSLSHTHAHTHTQTPSITYLSSATSIIILFIAPMDVWRRCTAFSSCYVIISRGKKHSYTVAGNLFFAVNMMIGGESVFLKVQFDTDSVWWYSGIVGNYRASSLTVPHTT